MEYTENYQLPRWVESDRILMEDFNQAMAAIDTGIKAAQDTADGGAAAAETAQTTADGALTEIAQVQNTLADLANALANPRNCRIAYGSYVGNGKAGVDNPNSLTFSFSPVLVIIGSNYVTNYAWPSILLHGIPSMRCDQSDDGKSIVSWESKKVSWYSESGYAAYQNNTNGTTYCYVAIGYDSAE